MLLFIDGFDHYAAGDIAKKWTSILGSTTKSSNLGRRGGGALKFTSNSDVVSKAFTASETVVVGFAIYFEALGSGAPFISFYYSATGQMSLFVTPSGSIAAYSGIYSFNTKFGESASGVFSEDSWYYVEIKTKFHGSAGTIEVRVNGSATPVLNVSGKNTAPSGNNQSNSVRLIGVSSGLGFQYVDDLYILETGSSPNDDFLGDCRVDTLMPNADGYYGNWQANSSPSLHYQLLDESSPNTSDYIESSTASNKDSWSFDNLTAVTGSIFGAAINLASFKSDAGDRSIKPLCRSGSTDSLGSAFTLSTDQLYAQKIYEVDPNTSSAWAEANVNSAEFGVECE